MISATSDSTVFMHYDDPLRGNKEPHDGFAPSNLCGLVSNGCHEMSRIAQLVTSTVAVVCVAFLCISCVDGPGTPTLAQYETLQPGMSYSQVRTVLGREGRELARTQIGTMIAATFEWRAGRLGVLHATFQDGRLVTKAQQSLPPQ